MLKVSNLSAGYGKSQVLNGLNFEVNAGEIVTLIGANGAGKTTTLKALCGVIGAMEARSNSKAGTSPTASPTTSWTPASP